MFFSPEGERGSARVRREAQARRICQACPVVEPCRRHALTSGEPYGVWGGLTESDRRKNSRRRAGNFGLAGALGRDAYI